VPVQITRGKVVVVGVEDGSRSQCRMTEKRSIRAQYAVKIIIDDPDQSKFPIGAQRSAAIVVEGDKYSRTRLGSIRSNVAANRPSSEDRETD
jgi:hypothetical protein